jgi:hypothetical protein
MGVMNGVSSASRALPHSPRLPTLEWSRWPAWPRGVQAFRVPYDIDIDAHQLCCDLGQPFDPILRIAELDGDIFSFNPSQLS